MSGVTGSQPTAGSPDPESDAGIAGTVTDEWVEVYPPEGGPPEPEPATPRPRLARSPTILFAGSVLFVLFGSLLPLGVASQGSFVNGGGSTIAIAAWRLTSSGVVDGHTLTHSAPTPIPVGFPIAIAAVPALLAVFLRLRAARGVRIVGVITATYLVTLVFVLGMLEIAWAGVFGPPDPTAAVRTGIGTGFWALSLAAVVASVGAGLAFVTGEAKAEPVADSWPAQPAAAEPEAPEGQPAQWPVVAVIPPDEGTNW
jgi:hypothetical protein